VPFEIFGEKFDGRLSSIDEGLG